MPTDQLVTAAHVLNAMMELERRTPNKVLLEWEAMEPDLMEFLLESLSQFHHQLSSAGLSRRDIRKLHRHGEKIALVCIMALRHAQRDLWDKDETLPGQPGDAPDQPA